MISVKALILFSAIAASGDGELLHFSAPWCGPCRQMQPIVSRLEQAGYPIRHVDVDRQRELAQRFDVRSIPCFVMLRRGQEVDRVVGPVSYDRLCRMFHAPLPDQQGDRTIRAQSPDPSPGGDRRVGAIESPPRLPRMGPSPTADRSGAQPADDPLVSSPAVPRQTALARGEDRFPPEDADPVSVATAATVRLRVDDDRGRSYGTGTIIDTHQDEALVVTCGHIFRESNGKGKISVDMFHPQARGPVPGTLIGFDLERDVALVSIRPATPITPVKVAEAGCRVQPGQPVFSLGCDRGREPRTMEGRVTAVDRYQGPPNLSVTGQPVDGRSGGGLFTEGGVLIGVCNAADPQDHEGLYAAAGAIHAELDRSGLGYVYRTDRVARGEASMETPIPSVASSPPRAVAPFQPMPFTNAADHESRAPSPDARASSLDDSEVICIVRSRSDPRATSRVIVLEQPSAEFLSRLALEFGNRGQMSSPTSPTGHAAVRDRGGRPPQMRVAETVPDPVVRGQTR